MRAKQVPWIMGSVAAVLATSAARAQAPWLLPEWQKQVEEEGSVLVPMEWLNAPDDEEQEEPRPHESRDHGPYIPGPQHPLTSLPFADRTLMIGVQVNTNAQGLNILGDCANEPSLAVNPANPNQMVVGWRQFDTISSNFRQAGWARSNDGGLTWTNAGPFTPGTFRSDPIIACDRTGRFIYNSLRNIEGNFQCDVFTSTTGGTTWTSPVFAVGGDKAWMCVDPTAGSGSGHLYENWTAGLSCCAGMFARSTDHGATWDINGQPQADLKWGTLDVDADGNLYIVGVDATGSTKIVKSTNAKNGAVTASFTSPVTVLPNMGPDYGPPMNPGGLGGQAWVACDRSTGPRRNWVYVACSADPAGGDPLSVVFTRSTDGGVTWSAPIQVHDEPSPFFSLQWFGTMSVAPTGRIDIVYLDTRSSTSLAVSALYYVRSFDGGSTWTPPEQITPTFNSRHGWPQQDKMGDYYHMVSDADSAMLAYTATFNNGLNGQHEQDVYFLRINASACDSIDFNRDGLFPDTADIDDFLSVFSGGPCSTAPVPGCNDIDFNNDGLFPDTADFDSLLNVFSGGSCG